MDTNGLAAYRKVQNNAQAEVADPYKLIQLLFKELMTSLAQTKGAMERGQLAEKGSLIAHCVEIVMALDESLNIEAGGEMAENLRNLYRYCVGQLLSAGPENNIEKLDEVTNLMKQIQEAWEGIGQKAPSEMPAAADDKGAVIGAGGVSGNA
ncbi:flagellar export chaperone FliS [Sansalvadorimonas verongulae]|uniref:flagellar export chaperone FliS n=1 Tax=Sansalvadorimonas verongulae TaxID=2172824 RepID=UPI0012BBD6F9|nr:flagellar export chaperone FliS [Sansalvadorimonas verongulae]MTI13257.1 flagellar export chaperone FliS [Sansalvadorimonas verongulae]